MNDLCTTCKTQQLKSSMRYGYRYGTEKNMFTSKNSMGNIYINIIVVSLRIRVNSVFSRNKGMVNAV